MATVVAVAVVDRMACLAYSVLEDARAPGANPIWASAATLEAPRGTGGNKSTLQLSTKHNVVVLELVVLDLELELVLELALELARVIELDLVLELVQAADLGGRAGPGACEPDH